MSIHLAEQPVATRGPIDADVQVPGSKSITNRALVTAGLAAGTSRLLRPLESDDTRVMREAWCALGARIHAGGEVWTVEGCGGVPQAPKAPLWAENSGTTARFLTAVATLCNGPVVVDGVGRMRERPIRELVDALVQLGGTASIEGNDGCPPVRIEGGGLPGGTAIVDGRRSSQFVSALLLAAPYAKHDVTLSFANGVLVSRPYVDLTLQVMRSFGAEADWYGAGLRAKAGAPYRAREFAIEADASAAAYAFGACAIAGGRVRVEGIPKQSLQADLAFADALVEMGCSLTRGGDFLELRAPTGGLRGIDIDMNPMPDAALAMAVVALFAKGKTHIRNLGTLRVKETDRLTALTRELAKLGARAQVEDDDLEIEPGPLAGAAIDTYDDHRMAMAFSLAGLRVPDVVIRDPGCVSKTWPDYFSWLERL